MLIIKNWRTRIENSRTAELKRMLWMPMPTDCGSDFQITLLDHDHGAQHLACWFVMCQIAAGQPDPDMRGQLARSNGTPHDRDSLARMSRIPAKYFEGAITRLRGKDLDAIDEVDSLPPHCHDVATTLPPHGNDPVTPSRDVATTRKRVATTRKHVATTLEDSRVEESTGQDKTTLAASPRKVPDEPVERDEVWDCVVSEFFGGAITDVHRGQANAAVRDLKKLGATPASIKRRIKNYRLHWPNITCTCTGLVKQWHTCADEPLLPGQKPYPSIAEIDRLLIEGYEQDNGPDLVYRAKEKAAKELAEKQKGANL